MDKRVFWLVSEGEATHVEPDVEFDGIESILVYAMDEAAALELARQYDGGLIGVDNVWHNERAVAAVSGEGVPWTEGESVEITHEGETYTATVREGGRVSIARGEAWSGDGTLLVTAGRACIVDCTADLPESVYDALGAALTNGRPEA